MGGHTHISRSVIGGGDVSVEFIDEHFGVPGRGSTFLIPFSNAVRSGPDFGASTEYYEELSKCQARRWRCARSGFLPRRAGLDGLNSFWTQHAISQTT